MSTLFRKTLTCLVAVFAVSALAASAASAETAAEQQQFGKELVKQHFTSKEGKGTLTAGGKAITCKEDTNVGETVGKESVQNVVVTFTGCEEPKTPCKVNSPGQAAGVIVTNALRGELGEVAKAEATSEVGLLLEPTPTKAEEEKIPPTKPPFVVLEGSCIPTTAVEGKLVGEVTPLALSTKHNLEFALSAGKQKIKTFERSFAKHCGIPAGGNQCEEDAKLKPKLTAFGLEATEESLKDEVTFEEAVEVMKGL
jgi:hypothetical protein